MTDLEWIVCERTGRWAAALRTALERQATSVPGKRRLHEVRSWKELDERLGERPRSMALIEVRRTNLAEALTWLANAGPSYPSVRCIALLDGEGFDHDVRVAVARALLTAGAVEIADSPRHLRQVLVAGRRHAASQTSHPTNLDDSPSFAEWAWNCLPWQPA